MKLIWSSQGFTQLEIVLKMYHVPFSAIQLLPNIQRSSSAFISYRRFGQHLRLLEKGGGGILLQFIFNFLCSLY